MQSQYSPRYVIHLLIVQKCGSVNSSTILPSGVQEQRISRHSDMSRGRNGGGKALTAPQASPLSPPPSLNGCAEVQSPLDHLLRCSLLSPKRRLSPSFYALQTLGYFRAVDVRVFKNLIEFIDDEVDDVNAEEGVNEGTERGGRRGKQEGGKKKRLKASKM
ncbi:hypothetical protein TrVE_jg1882 [Triparma verrucosa]|uniref:Uncharacterized protein n=1 Tax=Triparma verrucosa TaxID=1606542 RepID=A0A9W7EX80_9STRA|nr:hypothetical protein TrVE_jg1882 [Triparma verrucosa]